MARALEGRKVLVVGAGTRPTDDPDAPPGNGQATAVAAARAGAAVACADRDPEAAAATVARVAAAGGRAHALVADVADPEQCATLAGDAATVLGGLDGLVCNVGIGESTGTGLTGTTAREWDEVFAVNVRSHFLLTAAALPLLADGGAIVYVSSVVGLMGGSHRPAYEASKAALSGVCRQAVLEGGPRGIRANIVAPGPIDTPMGRDAGARRPAARVPSRVPLGRSGTPWEVAGPVVFLLSDAASYVTGQLLAVDGGLSRFRC